MIDPLYSMALITGLLGSGHCIGMCGGIVAALSISGEGRKGGLPFHLLYNAGRIATYTMIGLLVGWLGSVAAFVEPFHRAAWWVLLGSDLFVILLGLGTAGLFARLNVARLEFPGPMEKMAAAVRGLRTLPPAMSALPLGLVGGLLPCGFLYATALAAGQSAVPFKGALTMLAFGLGTVPALFFFGSAAHLLTTRARTWMLKGAGLMVALMGAWNLVRHLRMMKLF